MKKPVPHVPSANGARSKVAVSATDPHALYEVAVQGVEWDLDFLERVWRYRHPGREPKLFREAFGSPAALWGAGARRGRARPAWGVAPAREPLAWARRY